MLHYLIGHVGEMYGFAIKMLATDAEKYFGVHENLRREREKGD